jgi:hypothetical protein
MSALAECAFTYEDADGRIFLTRGPVFSEEDNSMEQRRKNLHSGFLLDFARERSIISRRDRSSPRESPVMIILLIGVACVGKSTTGGKLADEVVLRFFDLDVEIERDYGKSISSLKKEIITKNCWG